MEDLLYKTSDFHRQQPGALHWLLDAPKRPQAVNVSSTDLGLSPGSDGQWLPGTGLLDTVLTVPVTTSGGYREGAQSAALGYSVFVRAQSPGGGAATTAAGDLDSAAQVKPETI